MSLTAGGAAGPAAGVDPAIAPLTTPPVAVRAATVTIARTRREGALIRILLASTRGGGFLPRVRIGRQCAPRSESVACTSPACSDARPPDSSRGPGTLRNRKGSLGRPGWMYQH